MEEERPEVIEQEKKEEPKKNSIVVIIITLVIAILIATPILLLQKPRDIGTVDVLKDNKVEQQVIEDKLNFGNYILVTSDMPPVISTAKKIVIPAGENVYSFELTKGNLALVNIISMMGDIVTTATFTKDGEYNGISKITEVLLYPEYTIEVLEPLVPDSLKAGNDVEITLTKLNKKLDTESLNKGKKIELVEKEDNEPYVVGKDIPVGVYDVVMTEGITGAVDVQDKNNSNKITAYLFNKEDLPGQNIYKNVKLNEGDQVFALKINYPGPSEMPENNVKYQLVGQ